MKCNYLHQTKPCVGRVEPAVRRTVGQEYEGILTLGQAIVAEGMNRGRFGCRLTLGLNPTRKATPNRSAWPGVPNPACLEMAEQVRREADEGFSQAQREFR